MSENILSSNVDKAGENYWSEVWERSTLPDPLDIDSKSLNSYPYRILDKLFRDIFKDIDTKGKKLLEIGCGNSVLLPYLAKEFGFEIYGIDYSKKGCKQSELILERDGINGVIMCEDAFNPNKELLNSFDVVCSFGVAEHFLDTSGTLKSFSDFLKPGGILVTSIPNMKGATGFLHKWLNKPVYDIHVPLDREDLKNALTKANLTPLVCEYFLAISFAITLDGIDGKPIPNYMIKKVFIKILRYSSKLIWILEMIFGTLRPGRLLSGGVITSARKQ
jgi:2-polyprenyl-3-methyl-5-hydroxy-6-metoxy-1,4-benzoquinol methylase